MSNSIKEIDTKNWISYFSDDIFNIKNLDPNKINVDQFKRRYSHLLHWIYDNQNLSYMKINIVNSL